MIRVTVELISAVHSSRSRLLGIAEIGNDGTGGLSTGNYKVRLSKAGAKSNETWRCGEVRGFPRKRLGGWDLLYRALHSCVGDRNTLTMRHERRSGLPAQGWHWWYGVGNDRHVDGHRPKVPQWWCVRVWRFQACTYASAGCWVAPMDMQLAEGKWGPEIIPPGERD